MNKTTKTPQEWLLETIPILEKQEFMPFNGGFISVISAPNDNEAQVIFSRPDKRDSEICMVTLYTELALDRDYAEINYYVGIEDTHDWITASIYSSYIFLASEVARSWIAYLLGKS